MRKIPEEQIKAIQDKAKELNDLVAKADCRFIAYSDGSDWDFSLKVVPCEVEMGENGVVDDDGHEAEPIDSSELQDTEIYGTICSAEFNHLWESGECAESY